MARTGIAIKVTNTVLGSQPKVNANSMLIVVGAKATTASASVTIPFTLDTPYLIQSMDDLDKMGILETGDNAELYKQISDFYAPTTGVNNTGTFLWVVGVAAAGDVTVATKLVDWVRSTVVSGFQYRPRNILVSYTDTNDADVQALQKINDSLYTEGFSTVMVVSGKKMTNDVETEVSTLTDLSQKKSGMVGKVIVTKKVGGRACVGAVGGYLSSLSVGTSIGDSSLPAFSDSMYFIDKSGTPCARASLSTVNLLGDKQYIFARTRPPKNGLWFNDGATAEDSTTALSTLEAGRTIAALVDDLREFFTPYINSKVPCKSDGDIETSYKRTVLDNARAFIVSPYISSGDISDARIELVAKNNDMVGTRTWEVTLSILPAPTLRWVDGFVFYVKSLA